jgi:hypothetical protein
VKGAGICVYLGNGRPFYKQLLTRAHSPTRAGVAAIKIVRIRASSWGFPFSQPFLPAQAKSSRPSFA